MTSTAQDHDLTARPIWTGLMGVDDEGAYLVGGKCEACGFTTLGLRDVCPDCWAEGTMRQTPIGRRGRIGAVWTGELEKAGAGRTGELEPDRPVERP